MFKNNVNSWFAVFVISMTDVVQFVFSLSLIVHDIECPKTVSLLFSLGFTIIPLSFAVDGIWRLKNVTLVFKACSSVILSATYIASYSYVTVKSILECPNDNMIVWLFQGMSVPVLVWTLTKLIRHDDDKCKNGEAGELIYNNPS
jgi:hypothetical protein